MKWTFWCWFSLLLVHFHGHGCFGCTEEERLALVQIKASFYANGSSAPPSWDDEKSDCCQWENVVCNNETRRVNELYLNSTRDSSNEDQILNVSLFLPFKELMILNLSSNSMMGLVDDNDDFKRLPKLSKLELLDLSINSFDDSILAFVGALSSLKILSLASNIMEGSTHFQRTCYLNHWETSVEVVEKTCPIFQKTSYILQEKEKLSYEGSHRFIIRFPSQLQLPALHNLVELDLSYNLLKSFMTIQGLKNMSKLRVLNLNSNQLNMSTLQLLGALPSLKKLYLSENTLEGYITVEELNSLINLEVLDLSSNNISRNFLQAIELMTSLKALSLRDNGLNGIPMQDLCKLKNLEELDLSGNSFEGTVPSCLGKLTSLRALDISRNQLSGNISSSFITSLTSLEFLSLSHNVFQSLAPFSSFANHSKLEVFELISDNNGLVVETDDPIWIPPFQLKIFRLSNCTIGKGSFPSFLSNQYDLRVIDLSHNNLVGDFPTWLMENNTRIEVLHLKNNSFMGQFRLPFRPNIYTSLIDISNNNIRGQIPSNISVCLPNLKFLNVSKNSFEGSIPSSFGDMRNLILLDLSNNSFSGGIPENLALGCSSLQVLKLSNNDLNGQVFPKFFNLTSLKYLLLDGNRFLGKIPDSLSSCSDLQRLDISYNSISGKLPGWMGNMTSLAGLLMPGNHLEGPIPVEFCSLETLTFLDLSQNNLSGSIPSCFSRAGLQHLRLQENELTGLIPKSLSKSMYLMTLDISNNHLTGGIPNWISKLESLSILLLKENHLGGKIPTQLCQLSMMTILDLSYNNLSGPIPSCLNKIPFKIGFRSGKFVSEYDLSDIDPGSSSYSYQSGYIKLSQVPLYSYPVTYDKALVEFTTKNRSDFYRGNILYWMTGIDLSSNKLMGALPPEIGALSRIYALNLSHNKLTGSIPATFSGLKKIESLDLSYNNFSGTIPQELTELTSLAIFTVAYNNLSGEIPDKGQFGSYVENSYEGNPLLCGKMLKKNCTSILEIEEDIKEDSFIDIVVFCVSFAVSYIAVLLTLAAVLYINPDWRRKWFHLIDSCVTSCYKFFHCFCKFSANING